MFRGSGETREVLIGHMGGPFWARREERAWTIPKGLLEPRESPLEAAVREFEEETGLAPPPGPLVDLGAQRQRSGKLVHAFAVEADLDLAGFSPGMTTVTVRGRSFAVPEIDRVAYVPRTAAERLLVAGQVPFLAILP